jgi:SAM-dependent methyltransferase
MEPSVYQYPSIFRRVHMEKPGEIEEETEFLKKVWRRHLKKPVRRVLDIASGDSPHGQILAREGMRVVGIDRSPTMMAFFMSETFPVLITNDDLLSHLQSVGRLIRRGGLYCIDIDKMDRIRMVRERKRWQRRKVRTDDATVEVTTYDRPFPWYSATQSIFELECQIKFQEQPDQVVTTRDIIPIRYTVPPLLELAAKASRLFEMIAVYADLSFVTPLAECDRRWLGVLQRV